MTFRHQSRHRRCIANGPFRSKLEEKIYSIVCKKIEKKKMKLKIEINRRGLIPQNKRLELDLYFPDHQLGIEIQGPCHWTEATIILKDFVKMRYFQARGIDIMYVYTNSTKQMNQCIERCVDSLTTRQRDNYIYLDD